MAVSQIKPQTDLSVVRMLERIIEDARQGNITDIVVVASGRADDGSPAFMRNADFEDGWRLLGALEYAKATVLSSLEVIDH